MDQFKQKIIMETCKKKKNCHRNEKNNKVKIPANQMKKERRKKLKKIEKKKTI
jgi:hypothetical protein